jgi:hypothetical protein
MDQCAIIVVEGGSQAMLLETIGDRAALVLIL